MKRNALLIGNSDGLEGVKIDIRKFRYFLKSRVGGKWKDEEITEIPNPSKFHLQQLIYNLKRMNYDFSIIYFSGHGKYVRDTELVLNKNKECISESELKGISTRQISIFDCCRGVESANLRLVENIRVLEEQKKQYVSELRLCEEERNRLQFSIDQAKI
jgi:hypothetical protein